MLHLFVLSPGLYVRRNRGWRAVALDELVRWTDGFYENVQNHVQSRCNAEKNASRWVLTKVSPRFTFQTLLMFSWVQTKGTVGTNLYKTSRIRSRIGTLRFVFLTVRTGSSARAVVQPLSYSRYLSSRACLRVVIKSALNSRAGSGKRSSGCLSTVTSGEWSSLSYVWSDLLLLIVIQLGCAETQSSCFRHLPVQRAAGSYPRCWKGCQRLC